MNGNTRQLYDAGLLCLETLTDMPATGTRVAIKSSGVAALMVSPTDAKLAFCPAASSEVVVMDLYSGTRISTWAALGRELDSHTSTLGSLVETSWAADGTVLLRLCDGSICASNGEGSLMWHWPGVNASERIVHAVWLGESTVAALTTAGKIYTVPNQTGTPATVFMQRLTALHRYFRCLAYDQSNSRLVVVAEDGRASKAKTSQQLAAALSVSVWDITNLNQPLLMCAAGSKQGLIQRGMSPRDMQQGWDVALTPTHLAVTLPTRTAAVYQLQLCSPSGSEDRLQLTPLLSLGNVLTPDQPPPAGKGGQPLGDSLLRCGSNPLWWGPSQLAFVGPDGCLQVVQVPSGEKLLYVDSHYFLPGSRIVASSAVHGRPRSVYVLSALIQAAKPLGRKARKSTAPTLMRRWMVVSITQMGPHDKLNSLISQLQWQAALDLAAEHQLSTDDVYKSQWLAEASSRCDVPGHLANIADRAWVVQQCLSHTSNEYSRQQSLLQYGLQVTADQCDMTHLAACAQGEVDIHAEAAPWWLLQRVLLLEQLDALDTFMALLDRQFSEAGYKEFRQSTLEKAAMAAARSGSFTKLQLLCERHPQRLVPGMLALLACLPETASHEVYSQLLSLVSDCDNSVQRALLLREDDWVEAEAMTSLAIDLDQPAAACATEHLAAHQAQPAKPPSPQEVAAWLTQRAQAVEEMTGQLHTAAHLLRLAQHLNPEDALARHLSTVAALQEGLQEGAMDGEVWGLSLSQFTQLSPHEQVLLLVPEGNAAAVDPAAATAHRVAKLIAASVQPEDRQQLLVGLVQEDAPRHLPWLVHIFERLRLQRQAGTAGLQGLQTLEQAQQQLPDELHKSGKLRGAQEMCGARTYVVQAEGQCRAGQLLAGLGLDISLPGIRAATPAAAKDVLMVLLAKLADTVPPLSESRWLEVGEEVQEAAKAGLPGLSEEEVKAQLCFALLRSARFNLAKTYLTGSQALPSKAARAVVLQAAQAFFQSAVSMEAEEIGLGQITLGLLPHDPEVQQQVTCLQALQELQDYGLQLLPAQYNQVEDKMQLMKSAVNLSDKAYKHPEAVKHLAGLLGLTGRGDEVSMCVGTAALLHNDVEAAQQTCLQLIRRDHASAWRLCAAVMRSGGDEVGSRDTHVRLLSFAAHYCPARRLTGILAHLRLIKQGLHHSALSPEPSPSPQSSQSSSPTAVARQQRTTRVAPCASPERMQQILRAAVDAPLPLEIQGRALPGQDDSQMGMGCLMHLGSQGWELLQGMVDDAPSPRHARRALLMGLKAAALKVLMAQQFEGSLQEQSHQARALWGSAPWTLADQCSKLSCEELELEPELQQAQEWCARYAQQLHSQKDTLQIKEALPETDLQLFTGSSTASTSFRVGELTRLVTEAGQAEDVALGQGSLEQALALADKYSSPKWELTFAYTSSLLLTWQHQTEEVVPVVRHIFPALMQKPSATVHQLLLVTWPELQGQRQLHVGFCLKMLEMCYKHVFSQGEQEQPDLPVLDQPQAAIQRLVQLQSFARGMAATAAGMDIKPLLTQYLPAQLLLLVITTAAGSSGEAENGNRLSSNAEELAAELGSICVAAVEELCLHCNSSNVQELADLIKELPSSTEVDTTTSGARSMHSMAGVEFEFELSSSTAFTAAACATLREAAGLQQGEDHMEACQEAAGYLPALTAPQLQRVLLWCALEEGHPLLPSGPQLPEQLPADVRLTLLQTGLQLLLRHAEAGVQFEEDSRLHSEANRLEALCAVQQSCELLPEQWGMVERALEAITAAAAGERSSDDSSPSAVRACVGELVSSGLAIQEVLAAAESLQGLVAVMGEEEQSKPPPAAEVVSAVVQQQTANALAALSTSPQASSPSTLTSHSAPSSGGEGDQSERHVKGVAQQEEASFASGDQAVGVVLGVLRSLQSSGISAEAHDLVALLRQHVWRALQHHLFSRQDLVDSSSLPPAQLQLLEAVLTLFSSQSNGEEPTSSAGRASPGSPEKGPQPPVIRWQDWSPAEEDSSSRVQGQQMLLVSCSRAVVGGLWADMPLARQDLASQPAAQKLFLRLVERADGVEQLQALQDLLAHVWLSGDAIPTDQAMKKNGAAAPKAAAKSGVDTSATDGSKTVLCKNLPWGANDEDLSGIFADCGEVTDCRIAVDRKTGRAKGFAHIQFDSLEGAAKALSMSGQDFGGCEICIDTAQEQTSGGGGGSFGGDGGGGSFERPPSNQLSDSNGLDKYMGEDAVREHLTATVSNCGAVSSVRLLTDRKAGELNGIDSATTEAKEADSNSQDCRPLHACWSALLQRMLKADQTELVLRALDTAPTSAGSGSQHSVLPLLTPHEAHQLVETARTLRRKGAAASIALLQTDIALVDSALNDLADSAITETVQPDMPLLSILLQKGLFERVAGGLQAQLIKCLSTESNPPPLIFADFDHPPPASHDIADARSILLPATISLLASRGYYAQASALCVFHTQLHPAFASFESGMQHLYPYLHAHQQVLTSDSKVLNYRILESWPLPSTLSELHKSLSELLVAGVDRMANDSYRDYF